MKKIAVFGSAFNPPHRGHEDVIEQALGQAEKVVLVPSYRHAFGKHMMPFNLRMSMVAKMLEDMGSPPNVVLSDIEQHIAAHKPPDASVYTFEVLEALEKLYGTDQLIFVLGPDNANPEIWQRFYRAQEILDRWEIWAASERIPVRSSNIREKLARQEKLSTRDCSPQVIDLLENMR